MRAMQKLKHVSTNTKALIMGNGDTYLQHFRQEVDRFLDDAHKLNEAAWQALLVGKARLYELLDAFTGPDGKKQNKELAELRRAWKRALTSGRAVAKDVQRTAREVQNRRTGT